MSDTTAEEKSKPREPAKKGLHGWKAALAVFGCGTLAAFGVFGVIVGVLSLFLGTLSSGVDSSPNVSGVPGQAEGEPIKNLEPGELNLCEQDVQYSHNQSDPYYISENYDDPAFRGEGEDRTITDECSWEIRVSEGSALDPWDFTYSYEAVISTPGNESPSEVASRRYEEMVDESLESFEIVSSSGETDISERSYYNYGRGSSGEYVYSLVGQTRSTAYMIYFVSPRGNGEVSMTRFTNEARGVASMVEPALKVLVPE